MTAPTKTRETADILGIGHEFLLSKGDTDGSISVADLTLQPGTGAPLHTKTREDETYVVLEGSVTFVKDGAPTTVDAGDAIFCPRNQRLSWANVGEANARMLLIWTPGGAEGFIKEAAEVVPSEAPTGPPPPEAVRALQEIGTRYGVQLHDA